MSSLPIPTKYKYKVSNKVTVWAACSDGAVRQYSYQLQWGPGGGETGADQAGPGGELSLSAGGQATEGQSGHHQHW